MIDLRAVLPALAALLLLGGANCEDGSDLPADRTVAIRGRITDENNECPTMRDRNNRLYRLAGPIDTYKPGDRVCVKGRLVEESECGRGLTIAVEWIGPLRLCP